MSRADVIDVVSHGLAGLAVALQVGLVIVVVLALASLALPIARTLLVDLRETIARPGVWIAAPIAIVALAGSLFFSEYADFLPCKLCWYQRIAMYPLAVILPIAAFTRDRAGALRYGLPLCAIGAVVAIYQIYIEINPEAEASFCTAGGGPSCATKWIEVWGYVTIPVLSLTAFLAIGALLLAGRSAGRASRTDPEPV